ncbi:sulfite exporter TauE/SafE family protein [Arenibaculum pallidiluteum]|uniref:sulfite exporter TauE/SafE family protein n=1 Tax=Arenibaculum pallidiluteum TaxID=2812559 RepID=UPI001A97638E|nr:sulfite exporter TauE/SafE family protein [Arenibaculum pallidiluteum]
MDPNGALALLELGLAHCGAFIGRDGGILLSLLTAGLVGGTTHCAGMCGPFVLSQVAARLESVPASRMGEWTRLVGAAALPYHLGRATTYAALGAVASGAAGTLSDLPGLRWISVLLLGFAALSFLAGALGRAAPILGHGRFGQGKLRHDALQRWGAAVARLARPLFGNPVGWRGYRLGLALGFIPCGLLYGALAVAAASASPLTGAVGMVAFALGTLPSLLAVGLAGHGAARLFRGVVMRAAPLVMMANALVLGWMAYRFAAG